MCVPVLGLNDSYVAGRQWANGVSPGIAQHDKECKKHQRHQALHLAVDVDLLYSSILYQAPVIPVVVERRITICFV